jgi:opacity protein-like surface antigen
MELARASPAAAWVATLLVAGVAAAQSDTPWNGPYLGVSAGSGRGATCTRSTLNAATLDSAGLTLTRCPSGGLIGGAEFGDNFQIKRLVWGIAADVDAWSAQDGNLSLKYAGGVFPPGTYAYSEKLSPNDFIVVGPRIGYAGDLWLPYLRVGALIAAGSRDSTLSYSPAGSTKPTASFSGGKDFGSTGWVAGGGAEIGLNGAWSITVEYLHVNLGKGSDPTSTCNGSAAACSGFSGISLDSTHGDFTANIFRVGINYWFRYWEP